MSVGLQGIVTVENDKVFPSKPECTIVIFISQAGNCCRNSRLVVDEDDLKWVANGKKTYRIIKTVL